MKHDEKHRKDRHICSMIFFPINQKFGWSTFGLTGNHLYSLPWTRCYDINPCATHKQGTTDLTCNPSFPGGEYILFSGFNWSVHRTLGCLAEQELQTPIQSRVDSDSDSESQFLPWGPWPLLVYQSDRLNFHCMKRGSIMSSSGSRGPWGPLPPRFLQNHAVFKQF